jgi:hypothetical protein
MRKVLIIALAVFCTALVALAEISGSHQSPPASNSQSGGSASTSSASSGPWTEANINDETLWSSQPVLNDLLYDKAAADELVASAKLEPLQVSALNLLAENVLLKYLLLDTEARPIMSDMTLSPAKKGQLFSQMRYNERILEIVNSADAIAGTMLRPQQHAQLLSWARNRYQRAARNAQDYAHRPPPDMTRAPILRLPGVERKPPQ